ncbi:uncharacterized protein A4U43_C04F3030 [Asparagus officinalis]|uniref:C2H2-type domain-containing protein n=1 Tax=Asparagus officinalis TaxID=4686 RepID=A0A5P1EXV8_ASPOF|nr:uncharacterized protein A4U43_C04F3030 [Asparagus officinalis]
MATEPEPPAQVIGATESAVAEIAGEKVFPCNYCNEVFYCSQAFGDHQNAHRQERSPTKKPQEQHHGYFGPYASRPPSSSFFDAFIPIETCQQPYNFFPNDSSESNDRRSSSSDANHGAPKNREEDRKEDEELDLTLRL